MANNNDSSGKGPVKPVPDSAPKKPMALIDLKATEVDIRDPRQAAKTEPTKPAETASPLAGAAKVADAAAKSAATPTPSASAAKPGAASTPASQANPTASAAYASGSTAAGSARTSMPGAPPAPPAASGGGLRSAATHLVAGLAGGLIALLGADRLAPHLGLVGTSAQVSPDIAKRLSALESSATRSVPGDIAQKLAAAEARLTEVDSTGRTVAALVQQQAKLEAEAKALSDRLAAAPPSAGADIGDAATRIARLEEILGTISAAAKDPQAGRVPQLAAIAGRLAGLESNVAAQVAALRKSVTQEVDNRLGQSSEAAEAARTGTQRLDRELAGVKTEAAQLSQRLDGIKAQADRADVAVRGLRDEASALKAEIGAVNEDLKRVARPTDVATALTPLTSKLSLLEQNVQGVVRSEDDRRANVERIVTALELGNLKRTVDRGAAFDKELAEVRRVAGPKLDLTVLERYRDRGVPAVAELERDFRTLAFAIIDADQRPADAHWTDRLLSSAKSIVRVRRTDQGGEAQGAEAIVARMEAGLKASRLMEVVAEAAKLSAPAKAAAATWLEKVEARLAVDRAIAAIEQELKSSLGAATQSGKRG